MENIFEGRGRLLRAITGGSAAEDLCAAILVVAQGEFRAVIGLEVRERGKRDALALVVAHIELRQVLRIRSVRRFGLDIYLPGAAEIVEVINEQATHICLNGLIDIADRDTLLKHFVAVNIDVLLWHTRDK